MANRMLPGRKTAWPARADVVPMASNPDDRDEIDAYLDAAREAARDRLMADVFTRRIRGPRGGTVSSIRFNSVSGTRRTCAPDTVTSSCL